MIPPIPVANFYTNMNYIPEEQGNFSLSHPFGDIFGNSGVPRPLQFNNCKIDKIVIQVNNKED